MVRELPFSSPMTMAFISNGSQGSFLLTRDITSDFFSMQGSRQPYQLIRADIEDETYMTSLLQGYFQTRETSQVIFTLSNIELLHRKRYFLGGVICRDNFVLLAQKYILIQTSQLQYLKKMDFDISFITVYVYRHISGARGSENKNQLQNQIDLNFHSWVYCLPAMLPPSQYMSLNL